MLFLRSVLSYSKRVMSDTNDLVLTGSYVRPRELWPGVLMMTQERSRACLPPVESRHWPSTAYGAGWKGEQFSALWWHQVACAAALGGHVLSAGEAGCHTSSSVPSRILTEHICSVGGRAWL